MPMEPPFSRTKMMDSLSPCLPCSWMNQQCLRFLGVLFVCPLFLRWCIRGYEALGQIAETSVAKPNTLREIMAQSYAPNQPEFC